MHLHKLRLLAFDKANESHSVSEVLSGIQSKQTRETTKLHTSEKNTMQLEARNIFRNKNKVKCVTTVCNTVEAEKFPLLRKSKSEAPVKYSFSKVLEHQRKTISLCDIKKQLIKCSRMYIKRVRQNLQIFNAYHVSRHNTIEANINRDTKDDIEVILPAPKYCTRRRKYTTNSQHNEEPHHCNCSFNKIRSSEENIQHLNKHSCLKDRKKKRSVYKLRAFRKRNTSFEKCVPILKDSNRKIKRSQSFRRRHYNLIIFPSRTKRRNSKQATRLFQDPAIGDKYNCYCTIDRSVSVASLDKKPIAYSLNNDQVQALSPRVVKLLSELVIKSNTSITKEQNENPEKPARIPTKVKRVTTKQHVRYKILKGIILLIILIGWSPCILAAWLSWCLSYQFISRDNIISPKRGGECNINDDSCKKSRKNKYSLKYLSCGWTQLILKIILKRDSNALNKNFRCDDNINPNNLPRDKSCQSNTRHPLGNKKCILPYKLEKDWKVKATNCAKQINTLQKPSKIENMVSRSRFECTACKNNMDCNNCGDHLRHPKPKRKYFPEHTNEQLFSGSPKNHCRRHSNKLNSKPNISPSFFDPQEYVCSKCIVIDQQQPPVYKFKIYRPVTMKRNYCIEPEHKTPLTIRIKTNRDWTLGAKEYWTTDANTAVLPCSRCKLFTCKCGDRMNYRTVKGLHSTEKSASNIPNERHMDVNKDNNKEERKRKEKQRLWQRTTPENHASRSSPLKWRNFFSNIYEQIKSIIPHKQRKTRRNAWTSQVNCNRLYIRSLRRAPCAKCFSGCPSCYPYFLLCRRTCSNMCDQFLLCLAAAIYSPLLVCFYVLACLCCRICSP